jgi:hypothetical protein
MAVCKICKREMTAKVGCRATVIRFTPYDKRAKAGGEQRLLPAGQVHYRRLKFGEEKRYAAVDAKLKEFDIASGLPPETHCHDCAAPLGAQHHPGCDYEECPRCRRQLIACACNEEGVFTDLVEVGR